MTEERISELQDTSIETSQIEKQREKRMMKTEHPRSMGCSGIIRMPEGGEREWRKIFEEMMAENSQINDRYQTTDPEGSEYQKLHLGHIPLKLQKTKIKKF